MNPIEDTEHVDPKKPDQTNIADSQLVDDDFA